MPNAFKRGEGLPRAYLTVKLELHYTYIHTVFAAQAYKPTQALHPFPASCWCHKGFMSML